MIILSAIQIIKIQKCISYENRQKILKRPEYPKSETEDFHSKVETTGFHSPDQTREGASAPQRPHLYEKER